MATQLHATVKFCLIRSVTSIGQIRLALLASPICMLKAVSCARLRGLIPQAELARGVALQVVLIGVLIMLMLLWRPFGLLSQAPAVSKHAANP
jgi:ABC-type branched-subunit amino acid transport system permease subunit